MVSSSAPVSTAERITSLDTLRGIAILGILVINIQSFSMPSVARWNPSQFGDFTGLNYIVWLFSHVFFEGKFISLFALLFGAGVLLFMRHKEGGDRSAIRLHYRRTFWLLAIGLVHAYVFWDGDILVVYALCALVVVWARDWSTEKLAVVGVGLFAVPFIVKFDQSLSLNMSQQVGYWTATESDYEFHVQSLQGSWMTQMDYRVPVAHWKQTHVFVNTSMWKYSGMMLFGMALFKWGLLSDSLSTSKYRQVAAWSVAVGLGTILTGLGFLYYFDWAGGAGFVWPMFNYWGAPILAIGYASLVMLWCRSSIATNVISALNAVGRTALSNYLLQTLIATTILYGHGFGLFAQVSRVEQFGLVLAIWVFQIGVTVLWLSRYDRGPVEWIWRSLTYR